MTEITRREFLRVSATAAAGALLAACGPKATAVVEPTKPAVAEVKPTEKPKTHADILGAWPYKDVPREHTLVYVYGISVGQGNPQNPSFNHQNGWCLTTEFCAYYAAHADKTYMWLVESYEMSPDAKEWTLHFRKGIKWSDGEPFTAKDIAASMTRLKTVAGINKGSTYANELVSADVVDDNTLKVTLNVSDYRFFFKSLTARFDQGDESVYVPEHIFKDIADADLPKYQNFDVEKGLPVTTSAYGVSLSTDQLTYFDVRPTWWAVETGFVAEYPHVWRMIVMPNTSDTLNAEMLINNEVDQTLDMRPMTILPVLVQAPNLDTWTGKKKPYGYLDWWPISVQFCTQKPPFDNPKVRWAVAYALNQQQVVDVGWGGAGDPTNIIYPAFPKLMTYVDGIKDILEKYNPLEFNLEKSAALMTEAGFTKNAEGYWADKDGVVPDSDIYAAVPLFSDLAPSIAEQLRQAGFKCEHKAPQDVWAAKVDGRASMFLFGHGGSTIDPWDTLNLYNLKNSTAAKMGEQNWSNITRWSTEEFQKIADEMNQTPMDDPKVKDQFHRAMEIFYENLPDCPLCQWYHRIPLNTTYWDNWPTEANPYMNAAIWHNTGYQVVINLKAKKA